MLPRGLMLSLSIVLAAAAWSAFERKPGAVTGKARLRGWDISDLGFKTVTVLVCLILRTWRKNSKATFAQGKGLITWLLSQPAGQSSFSRRRVSWVTWAKKLFFRVMCLTASTCVTSGEG